MENVPPVFIKSVLCLSRLSTVEPFQKLSSRSWSKLAAEQMARRKNWTLQTHEHWTPDDGVTHNIGFFARYNESENAHEYASFQEFARMDPSLNQITGIWLEGPDDDEEQYDYENLRKGTKIATKQDVANFQRRFFSRINYSAIDWFNFNIADDIGLHSAVLHRLVDKQMLLKDLDLVVMRYEGPASIDLLKGLIQNRVIKKLHLDREWPSENMAPFLEAVIPQRQFRYLSYDAEISLSESLFPSLIDEWRNDTVPQKKAMFFRKLRTRLPLESGVYPHPKLDEQLVVKSDSLGTFLKFSSVTDPE